MQVVLRELLVLMLENGMVRRMKSSMLKWRRFVQARRLKADARSVAVEHRARVLLQRAMAVWEERAEVWKAK